MEGGEEDREIEKKEVKEEEMKVEERPRRRGG